MKGRGKGKAMRNKGNSKDEVIIGVYIMFLLILSKDQWEMKIIDLSKEYTVCERIPKNKNGKLI